MRFFPHLFHFVRADLYGMTFAMSRLVTTAVVFAYMLWLGGRASSAVADTAQQPVEVSLSPGAELAWWDGAEGGQMGNGPQIVSLGGMKINIEAYNRKREKDIADDSKKLLSLAIALKSDLEQDSGQGPSPRAISKANEIQKLAHDVKENMKLSIIGAQ